MARRVQTRERRNPRRFFSRLSSALFELMLIILLFMHALLSHLVHKFASYCKLPTPCLLCSRLGKRRPHFYKELICNAHKLEVSSLTYCRAHKRLGNGHEMCESCLLSVDVGSNANFLSKKFHGEDMIKAPLLKNDLEPGSLYKRSCSCCSAPLKNRRSLENKHTTEPDASLSGSHLRNGLSRGTENCSGSHAGDHCFERLSHTGYNEDDAWSLAREVDDVKEELLSRCLQASPAAGDPKNSSLFTLDDVVQDKLIHPSPIVPDISISIPERRLQADASHSTMSTGHGLEEINWNQVEGKPNLIMSSEIMTEQVPTEALITKLDVSEKSSFASNGDAIKTLSSADIGLRTSQIMNEKLSSSIKVPLPSPASSELLTARESSRVPEDLKVRLSQISSSRWLEFPWNEMSSTPRANGQGDESKLSDTSSYNGLPNQIKRSTTDRYESGVESLDGSFISEIEGESTVDRLKRQIEMDRKTMIILYKELEEERNASATSANEAMAMINRLQEEKAAMHMEALQYLRMMEEQAEYDQEALQKLNDLLCDRDKDIQDLEAMIESYRKQFGGEPLTGRVLESPFDCEEREYTEYTPVSTPRFIRSNGREIGKTLMRNTVLDFEDEKVHISECLRRLERKLKLFSNSGAYAIGSELYVKEDGFPNKNSILEDATTENGECFKTVVNDDQNLLQQGNATQENSQKEDRDITTSKEGSLVKVSSALQLSLKEVLKESTLRSISYNERQLQIGGKKNDIIALGNEISQLNVRLEALEEDRNFLEHAVSSLRNGSNGIQFIQEIACHLRELRQIGFTHQDHVVA